MSDGLEARQFGFTIINDDAAELFLGHADVIGGRWRFEVKHLSVLEHLLLQLCVIDALDGGVLVNGMDGSGGGALAHDHEDWFHADAAIRDVTRSEADGHEEVGALLGFWADALWHLCLADANSDYRCWLSEAMIHCHDAGFGMPPALLGANTEGLSSIDRVACPSLVDYRLRIANLGCTGRPELLIVNPSNEDILLAWHGRAPANLKWMLADGSYMAASSIILPARSWLWGHS